MCLLFKHYNNLPQENCVTVMKIVKYIYNTLVYLGGGFTVSSLKYTNVLYIYLTMYVRCILIKTFDQSKVKRAIEKCFFQSGPRLF